MQLVPPPPPSPPPLMEETFPLPSCFLPDPLLSSPSSSHRVVTTTYLATVSGLRRLISVTWSRTPLSHCLSLSLDDLPSSTTTFKLDLKPWHFWRRHGSKRLTPSFLLVWDLRSARFSGDPDPHSHYYIALFFDRQLVLVLGDLRSDALRRAGSPPSVSKEPTVVSRMEHAFARRIFATRTRFLGGGSADHEVSVEVAEKNSEMAVKVDGSVLIDVKRLQWKFRGNQSVWIGGIRVEVCWDVHDWLLGPGLRHGLFVFNPTCLAAGGDVEEAVGEEDVAGGEAEKAGFCLLLHAWKVD